jgi:hypothetical protein
MPMKRLNGLAHDGEEKFFLGKWRDILGVVGRFPIL